MKKKILSFFMIISFIGISFGQARHLETELGVGLVFPNTENPVGINSYVIKLNYYVPVTTTGDLIFGLGYIYYKFSNPPIKGSVFNDALSVSYSYNFIDKPEFVARVFGGYHASGFIFSPEISHSALLAIEGGKHNFKLRLSMLKLITPHKIQIIKDFNDFDTYKIYPTVITISILYRFINL